MRQSVRVFFVAAALTSLSGAAIAGDDHKAQRAQCRAAREAAHLPVYDLNRDGKLDQAERGQLRQDMRKRALAQYDADRDGKLSDAERTPLRRDRVAAKFAKLDLNRDGAISRQEAAQPCFGLARRFDAVDQDRNGSISSAELSAARMMFGKRGKSRFKDGAEADPDFESDPDAQY